MLLDATFVEKLVAEDALGWLGLGVENIVA